MKLLVTLLFIFLISSCNYAGKTSGLHYLLDMYDSIAVEDQEEDYTHDVPLRESEAAGWKNAMDKTPAWGGRASASRIPPEGSVPRNYSPYPYDVSDFAGAAAMRNPLVANREHYAQGQKLYNSFCAVCHGYTGLGDGMVTPRLSAVPSLMSKNMRDWSDGEFFHIITLGRARMLPYAAQVLPKERWAIIHYIRLLQAQPKTGAIK